MAGVGFISREDAEAEEALTAEEDARDERDAMSGPTLTREEVAAKLARARERAGYMSTAPISAAPRTVVKHKPHLVLRERDMTTTVQPLHPAKPEIEVALLSTEPLDERDAEYPTTIRVETKLHCETCVHYTASEFGTYKLCGRSGAEIHPNHVLSDSFGIICTYHD